MAATLRASQYKGSDVVNDVCCSICEDDGLYKEGLFYCPKCSKYFCDSCVKTHNKFHKDHTVTAKGEGDIWPDTKTVEDTLELCEIHTTEKLTMFCDDHEKLLCQLCLLHNHRQCSHAVPLADKIKSATRYIDIAQMSTRIDQLQKRLEGMMLIGDQHINSLQTSYERALKEILYVRQQINDNLDRLQQTTVRNLEQLHSSLKTSLENVSKQCVEFVSMLRSYDTKGTHSTSLERSFIIYRKCLDHSASADSFIRIVTRNVEIDFERNKELEQFLSSCTEFGKIASRAAVSHHRVDSNTVLSIKDRSQYNVRTPTDKSECCITGMCESSNGELVIADLNNTCVKLLDQTYNLIEQIQLPSLPWSICNISANEIALTVGNAGSVNEIIFLRVDKGRIVKFKTLQLKHSCINSIASHQSDLFVTSGSAVYQHTMDGRMVKELYKHSSGSLNGVGVSPDGKRIYVTDCTNSKLLTLTREDGAVGNTLDDPAFKCKYIACNMHVTATGQVFVFGNTTVSHVDTDGKTVLNTMNIDNDKSHIGAVYFSQDTRKMFVGFRNFSSVFEFKTHVS